MTKVVDINKNKKKPELRVVREEKQDIDKLECAMRSAIHSLRASRNWPQYKKSHLLNCRDALDRVSFYLDDEIKRELGINCEDTNKDT